MAAPTIAQAFQTAFAHHQAGRLAEAEAIYRQILAAEPNHADALHLLGVIALQVGRADAAIDLMGKSIALAPSFPDSHYNLGNALLQTGRLPAAIDSYRRAVALRPGYAEAFFNLGNALLGNRQEHEAIAAYRQAVASKPDFPAALSNLGNLLKVHGQLDEAIAAYRQALACQPDLPETLSNLGNALRDKGQLDEAISCCQRALALRPDYPNALTNLGNALHDKGHLDEAIACHRRAIAMNPNIPEAHSNLGNTLKDKRMTDEAIAAYRQAIVLRPDFPEAHSNLGIALKDKGQFADALASLRHAIALKPDYAEPHSNLGTVFCERGQVDEGIACYRRAIVLKPGLAEVHSDLAHALLVQMNFAEGWEEYEWRWELKESIPVRPNFSQPAWDGSPLAGRTILLHAEQGFGDTLQFIRYLPLVQQRGGKVILQCQPELLRLFQMTADRIPMVARGQPLPAFDVHCPLLSLPRLFGTEVTTIPQNVPYLCADPADVGLWQGRLAAHGSSLKVGIVWAGDAGQDHLEASRIDQRRSMRLSQFAPLAGVPGVVFVSLQKGRPKAQAQTPPASMVLLDWTDELKDFADTAALVTNLDLVITVDTAVAHLAGAMGRPVWLLNRFDTCWRWMLAREDTPWYPTMRLFRQQKAGEWEPVIRRVADELAAMRR